MLNLHLEILHITVYIFLPSTSDICCGDCLCRGGVKMFHMPAAIV